MRGKLGREVADQNWDILSDDLVNYQVPKEEPWNIIVRLEFQLRIPGMETTSKTVIKGGNKNKGIKKNKILPKWSSNLNFKIVE